MGFFWCARQGALTLGLKSPAGSAERTAIGKRKEVLSVIIESNYQTNPDVSIRAILALGVIETRGDLAEKMKIVPPSLTITIMPEKEYDVAAAKVDEIRNSNDSPQGGDEFPKLMS